MTRRFVTGRSRGSHMVLAWRNLHVFYWLWTWGSHSVGATLRWRTRTGWQHVRLVLWQRNGRDDKTMRAGHYRARRSVTPIELSGWRTMGGTRERAGLKWYVRLKMSPGGRGA